MKKPFFLLLLSLSLLSACNNNWTGFYYSTANEVKTKGFKTKEECEEWNKAKLAESTQEDAYECKENSTL